MNVEFTTHESTEAGLWLTFILMMSVLHQLMNTLHVSYQFLGVLEVKKVNVLVVKVTE